MNNADITSMLIAFGGVILSLAGSFFIAGMKWGQVTGEVRSINERLAKIEGMFTLTLKHDGTSQNVQ